jgi:cytochrome P450
MRTVVHVHAGGRGICCANDIASRLEPATEAAAERIVAAANGRMDVLKLSRDVTFEILLDYFGTPAPTNGDIVVWSTRLFESIFHIGKPDPALDAEVAAYASALLAHIQDLIKKRRTSGVEKNDVLGRCLQMQKQNVDGFSDREIRGALAGFLVAGLPQPPMVLPKIVEQLLRRPKILAEAQEAARRNDDITLAKYIFEAMRFDPLAPFLQRVAKKEHVLAAGTFRAKKIEPGTRVFFFIASAMMDGRRVANPKSFNPNRPPHHYIHFGHGLHQCFAIDMNKKLLPLMLKPLLKQHGFRRASGPEGRLRKQTVFPDRLTVCFDVDPAGSNDSALNAKTPVPHFSS